MDDLRDQLRESVESEFPRRAGPELVRRAVRRRQLRERLSAAFVGVTLAAGVVWFALQGPERSAPVPPSPGPLAADPLDVATLRYAWSANIPGATFTSIAGVLADDERIFVPTTGGIAVYPKDCSVDACAPVWTLTVAEGSSAGPRGDSAFIATGQGIVAATLDGRLAVARADCRTDGGECRPLWVADPPQGSNGYLAPLIDDGVVKVTLGWREMPNQRVSAVAFPILCREDGGACDARWIGELGVGTAHLPGAAVDGVFYQQVGTRLIGFSAACASAGGTCEPDFVIDSTGDPTTQESSIYGPVPGDGEVIFVAGTGSVVSYPEHCGTHCRPVWVGPVADYLETIPVLIDDLVVVSSPSGLVAFPVACRSDGGTCSPAWTTDLGRYVSVAAGDERSVVAVDHSDGVGVFVFPTSCSAVCRPRWTVEDLGPRVYGVASDGRTVFVAMKDEIVGYPLDCDDHCEPVWRGEVPGETWWIGLDDRRLLAASRLGDFGEELALTVFTTDP